MERPVVRTNLRNKVRLEPTHGRRSVQTERLFLFCFAKRCRAC